MTDILMDRPALVRLLRVAHDEIVTLRREIEALRPRAHAYDTIAQIARLTAKDHKQGYGEDIAWRLKQEVERITKERAAEQEHQP